MDLARSSSPIQKLVRVKIVLAVALLCAFGLSWRLWISSRLFPLCPISDFLGPVPYPLDYIWFFVLLATLALIIVFPQRQVFTVSFFSLAMLLSLWDQNRWQPWFYQYLLMLTAMVPGIRGKSEETYQRLVLNTCRLIIVSTYFWSGLQKLNANFVEETWPDTVRWLLQLLPIRMQFPAVLALAIPVVEIIIGLALGTRRFRNPGVALAIVTHVAVLILLIARGDNTVVWPWNVAMILFVILLFWRDGETTVCDLIVPKGWFHAIVLLLLGIMPAFSLFNYWDSYLSAALYSGSTDQAVIYISPAILEQLPVAIRPHVWQKSQPFFLDINRWSYGEVNVPLYPEPRIYKNIAKQVCTYAGNLSADVKLRIQLQPNLFTAHRDSELYDCDHLD